LTQIYTDDKEKLVRQEIKEGFFDIIKAEKELDILEKEMSLNSSNIEVIEKYTTALETFNNI
jgi:hypothetical protein